MPSTSDHAAVVARSAAASTRGPILGRLVGALLDRVEVEDGWVARMRELATRGTLVQVMLKVGILELLCLDQILRRHGLPSIELVSGAGRYARWPLRWVLALLWRRCRPCDEGCVVEASRGGGSSLLILQPAPVARKGGVAAPAADATEALLALQRETGRPVLLVPQLILWGRRRPAAHGGLRGWLEALREGPGLFRLIAQVLRARNDAQIRDGEPVDLLEVVRNGDGATDELLAREARFTLRRRFEQERRVVLGPLAKSPETLRDEILRGASLVDELERISRGEAVPVERLRKRARKILREIAAEPNSAWLAGMNAALWWIWSRLFEGVELDEEGFARLREVAHEGPVVLVSSHKSHVDYLILSQIFWEKNIFPPHIAAGRNLSFWPLGAVFRRCGAFFIRRRFAGDALYAAVLRAYVRKVLQEGYHLEFFIEGTRSRTGKMLPPKLGLLTMIWDAARRLKGHTVHIVPVSITYGRVPEEGSHAAESDGGEKRAENLGGLLRTRHVLRRAHGRIYVQLGQPIPLEQYLGAGNGEPLREASAAESRRAVTSLAYRTVYEINRVTLVTPTALVATVLLLNRRRGMTHATLRAEVGTLAARARRFGAHFSSSLQSVERGGPPPAWVLQQATAFLRDAGLVSVHGSGADAIYSVAPERRLRLDYYKSMVLHHFVHASVVAAALGPRPEQGRAVDELAERVRFLSRLLKHEFTFRADAGFELNLERTVAELIDAGELELKEEILVASGSRGARIVRSYAALIENYLESYRIVVRTVQGLGDDAVAERDLVRQALAVGERMYLVGEVELRESRAKGTFQNALRALVDLGVLARSPDRSLALSEDSRRPGRLGRLEGRIASHLDR